MKRLLLLTVLLAGCGASSSPSIPTVLPAKRYSLTGFQPSAPVKAGVPVTVSFTIRQPDGRPLTKYKHGAGPHNGVHLIIVRRDLNTIIHEHPPVQKDGRASVKVVFPEPGPYYVVVDAYPASGGVLANFQLFGSLHVAGTYVPEPLPPFGATDTVDGYTFTLHGSPHLKAIQPADLTVTVTDPHGKPAQFSSWFGALAHAIFFRKGSLAYFHTHVCAPAVSGCSSVLGAAKVTGTSATPGKLHVGILVPVPGTWRLFLQCRVNGHVLTAPFTLEVS